jgi:hypothetical protein
VTGPDIVNYPYEAHSFTALGEDDKRPTTYEPSSIGRACSGFSHSYDARRLRSPRSPAPTRDVKVYEAL